MNHEWHDKNFLCVVRANGSLIRLGRSSHISVLKEFAPQMSLIIALIIVNLLPDRAQVSQMNRLYSRQGSQKCPDHAGAYFTES